MAFSPDGALAYVGPEGAFLYVANSNSGTVSVVETATNAVVADSVATGSFPMKVTIEAIS